VAIILISRGTMAGGQEVAECLQKRSGVRCLTREDLIGAINARGEAAAKVVSALPKAVRAYQEFSSLRRPYKILMRLALLEFFEEERCAYLGYSGHLLLPNFPQYLRVRLLAPERYRLQRTMERLDLSEDDARDYIHRADEERLTWCRFMYGKDLRDPLQYDVCINMSKAKVDGVCSILLCAAQKRAFQATPESEEEASNLLLATKVLSELVLDEEASSLELGATAENGAVVIEGPYLDEAERDSVLRRAAKVSGVTSVDYRPGYGPTEDFGA
jgi:Cytidylate kinase-like family